jgi:hypothetical protein
MIFRFLLPLATLTLISGCGGSGVSSLNEIRDILSDFDSGSAVQNAVVNEQVNTERSSIQAIDAVNSTGSAMISAAAATGVPAVDATDQTFVDDLVVGEPILIDIPDEDSGTTQQAALIKLKGGSFGEQILVLSSDDGSQIIRSSHSATVQQANSAKLEDMYESGSFDDTYYDETLNAGITDSSVSFMFVSENSSIGEEAFRGSYKILVFSGPDAVNDGDGAVSAQLSRNKTIGDSAAFLHGPYMVTIDAGHSGSGSFTLPNGTHTYTGTVLLGMKGSSASASGTNLEMSVDFSNSTGTLSASNLTGENGEVGSMNGAFTVIPATGSFTGQGVATVNSTSEIGSITGSFDSSANLAAGIMDTHPETGTITGMFAAQKN